MRSLLGVACIVNVFALLLGVTFATTEYRHDTAATSFLAEPRRWRVLGAKAAVMLVVGAAVRSQVGGIVAVLVWLFVVESLIAGLLPSLAPWTPFAVAGAMVAPTDQVGQALAMVLTLGYVALALGAGTWCTERRDVV